MYTFLLNDINLTNSATYTNLSRSFSRSLVVFFAKTDHLGLITFTFHVIQLTTLSSIDLTFSTQPKLIHLPTLLLINHPHFPQLIQLITLHLFVFLDKTQIINFTSLPRSHSPSLTQLPLANDSPHSQHFFATRLASYFLANTSLANTSLACLTLQTWASRV